MNIDQKNFNSYVQPETDDPDQNWRWNGVRPVTRNRIISMAAHFVTSTLYPGIFAQNDNDEEDKDAANVMRYLVEYNIRNSDYELSYLFGILAALVNPVAYLHADYAEVMQTIKEKALNGQIVESEVVDEVLSGIHTNNVPADEILIGNAYEYYLQKQRFIIRRRFIDYGEVEALYQNHENFIHIQPGIKALYSQDDSMFYDQTDSSLQTLAEEVRYQNRREDTEVVLVNGIYLGDSDVNANPIKHRDNKNHPKYPYAKFGFEPIDEKRFYFYKSVAFKMADDQTLMDRMYQVFMDAWLMNAVPAVAGIGTGKLSSDIALPGRVTNFPKESSVKTILPPNRGNDPSALREIEHSMTESSQDPQMAGKEGAKPKTAYEVSRIEQNARTNLGIFGRMIIKMVQDYGELFIDNILHHQTVGEAEELLGGQTKMKFRTFLLGDQIENGRKVTRKIIFDEELIGKKMTKEQVIKNRFKLLKEQGGKDSDKIIYRANPHKFSQLRFKMIVDFDSLMPKNKLWEEELNVRRYDRAMQNPFTNKEAITRDLLISPWAKGETDKYMQKIEGGELEKLMGQFGGGQRQPLKQKALAGVLQE